MGDFPLLNLPETCTTEPLTGHASCKRHVHYIKELNKSLPEQKKIPTKLSDFLRFCGVSVKQGERLNVLTNFSENLAMLSASAAKKLCVICDWVISMGDSVTWTQQTMLYHQFCQTVIVMWFYVKWFKVIRSGVIHCEVISGEEKREAFHVKQSEMMFCEVSWYEVISWEVS